MRLLILIVLLPLLCSAEDEYELPPIRYSETQPHDPVQDLMKKLQSSQAPLNRTDVWTVIEDLMRHFEIPPESQVLVFSKTSKQNDRITPQTPRVIYFGDETYLGYTLGGSIEVAAVDPKLGPVFYLMEPHVDLDQPLRFERDQSCLSCHGGTFTPGVPGVLVRSVFPSITGHPILSQGSTVVDSTTPFSDRWGGWYVTGTHGDAVHRGNVIATEKADNTCEMPVDQGANVVSLTGFFDTRPYPRASSDIVALMVLEHQTSVQNALTKANHSALRALHMQTSLQKELGEPVQHEPVSTARRIIEHCVEDVLDALLFKDEAALPEGGIEGDEAFQTAFGKTAHRNSEGRSLKDFQLLNRLFKYRCSYMIHSRTFDQMQPALRQAVLARLDAVLAGTENSGRYDYLGESERRQIRGILDETLTR
ncbi:hypothetical protein EI77_01170 [Prosthecobacter fusiformis]|uniref:Cytochrome c domain-containing protein n=1 Tax=Prosthecobacter fusiformis TaxID=48464 RepID=A0A4R7SU92_9BACT|nr:hypothetical protein [Prosthecobacter fusiformis]TDU81858.1 hypothetical protein EI77_01170 [Prosthecobacter fusiformis]